MINPRITNKVKSFVSTINRVCFTPDLEADSHLYREFGTNNEIDIVRNKPQYEGVVNSHLQQVSDLGIDTSNFTDEQLVEGVTYGRAFDENELREFVERDKTERLKEIENNKHD